MNNLISPSTAKNPSLRVPIRQNKIYNNEEGSKRPLSYCNKPKLDISNKYKCAIPYICSQYGAIYSTV